jgi:hypothetical protein
VRSNWLEFADSLAAPAGSDRFPIVQRNYTDAEATVTQRLGSLSLAVTAGNRFGVTATRSWAYATLTVPVRERIGLSLASGWRPDQPERAQPNGAFAQISVRLDVRTNSERPAALKAPAEEELSLTAVPLDLGYRLRIRASAARSVALKGDITNWDVKELHKAEDGHRELEIEAQPGVYLINIRIDDQLWTVPAGLVAVSDSFGGLAGVLNLQ